jgi:hypothetical protein
MDRMNAIRVVWIQQDVNVMTELQIHPLVGQLPKLESPFFEILLRDMRSNGQHLPIVLYEGMIWDGRARYDACRGLGIQPWLVPLRRQDPLHFYILANEERCGEPHSPARKLIVDTLEKAGSREGRAEMRARRSRWIKTARAEFEEWERGERQPCAVCKKYIAFAHAHHSFPLSLQFECGVDQPIHDHQWLCPVHHKYVHVLLNGHLLGSNDLSFLDCIPDSEAEEWIAIEQCAKAGSDLCCGALGREPSDTKKRRYDPEYSLFLLRNPSLVWPAIEWKRSMRALRGIAA